MDACCSWSRRAGGFTPPAKRDRSCSDQRGSDLAGMIDSSLKNYRRIPLTLHSHRRQRHLLPSNTPSLKPGMLEIFTLPNSSYYP